MITTLIILAIIIAAPLIIALFVSKKYTVQRSIVINQPSEKVFDYVKLIKNQDYYSKWVMTDPGMKKEFTGTDGKVGFIYAWNGNKKAGEGAQEIIRITEGNKIEMEVRFKRPVVATAQTIMITESIGSNQTKVEWGMNGQYSYPLNFMNLFISGLLGKDIEISLYNLKNILEKR
jgi:hypothetical protein